MRSPEEILEEIAGFQQKWFDEIVSPQQFTYAPKSSLNRSAKKRESIASVFLRGLQRLVVVDVQAVFDLERCGLLLPRDGKNGIWQLSAHTGYPRSIVDQRRAYTPGVGLSGIALTGTPVISEDVLNDDRRSRAHGDRWLTKSGDLISQASPRAALAVPIWNQPSDLFRETLGAIICIREGNFSKFDLHAMQLVAAGVSNALNNIDTYVSRLEQAEVHAELTRIWLEPSRIKDQLKESLGLLRGVYPFRRMLLSLVNAEGERIQGVAVVGFRESLCKDTDRVLHSSPVDGEDILSRWIRERREGAGVVSRNDSGIDQMTALRHELTGDLVLIPFQDSLRNYRGAILAEIPQGSQLEQGGHKLSPAELQTCVLLATEICDLMTIAEQRFERSEHLSAIEKSVQGTGDVSAAVTELLRISHSSGVVGYTLDEQSGELARAFSKGDMGDLAECVFPFAIDHADHPISRVFLGEEQLETTALALRKPEVIAKENRVGVVCDGIENHSELLASILPLKFGGTILGVCVLLRDKNAARGENVLGRQRAMATLASICHFEQRSTLVDAASRAIDSQRMFLHIVSRLTKERGICFSTLHEIVQGFRDEFDVLLAAVASILNAKLCEIFLPERPVRLDERGQIPPSLFDTEFTNVVRYFDDSNAHEIERRNVHKGYSKQPSMNGLTASVLQTMNRQSSPDVLEDKNWSRTSQEFGTDQVRSWLGVPLVYNQDGEPHCWGVLGCSRERRSKHDLLEFREDDMLHAQHLGEVLASCLANRYRYGVLANRTESFLQRFDHDIPDLVLHVRNQLDSLAAASRTKKAQKNFNELTSSVSGLQACISSLLIAYAPRGVSAQTGHPCNLARVQSQVEQLVTLSPISGGIDVRFSLELPDEWSCCANEEYLVYSLFILMNNAFRACNERMQATANSKFNATVTVTANLSCSEAEMVEFLVQDNGVGFASLVGDANFFDEGRSYWNYGKPGKGVGRILARRLIAIMGGNGPHVVTNTGEQGAKVRFQLPATESKLA